MFGAETVVGEESIFYCSFTKITLRILDLVLSSSVHSSGRPFDPHWLVLRLIDEANSPAVYPDMQSYNLPPFTFKERVEELWTQISTNWKRYL